MINNGLNVITNLEIIMSMWRVKHVESIIIKIIKSIQIWMEKMKEIGCITMTTQQWLDQHPPSCKKHVICKLLIQSLDKVSSFIYIYIERDIFNMCQYIMICFYLHMCRIHLEALHCGYKLLHISYLLKNHSQEFCSSLCNICRCIIPCYYCNINHLQNGLIIQGCLKPRYVDLI